MLDGRAGGAFPALGWQRSCKTSNENPHVGFTWLTIDGWFVSLVNSKEEKGMTIVVEDSNAPCSACDQSEAGWPIMTRSSVENIDSRTASDRNEEAPLNRPEQNEISVLVASISEQGAELNELSRMQTIFAVLRFNDGRDQFWSLFKKHRKYHGDLHTDELLKDPNINIHDATDDTFNTAM